jgi:hypothetical protein
MPYLKKPNLDKRRRGSFRLKEFADRMTCRQFKDIDIDVSLSCSKLDQYLEEALAIGKTAERSCY